jgi:hypothetical protein
MNRRLGLVLSLTVLLAGCASAVARGKVLKQASFDHNCPKERIRVVDEDTDIWAYRLDVCGSPKKYRVFGNFQFVDVTDGPPKVPSRD